MSALYSNLLLEPLKLSLNECYNLIPSSDNSKMPTLAPWALDAPSTYNCHGLTKIELTWAILPVVKVNFTTKSTNSCPLMALRGLYLTLNDPSLVPHLAIRLVKYDLLSSNYKGCSVST